MIWLYDNIEMHIEGTIIVRVQMHLPSLRVERMNEGIGFFIAHTIPRAMSVYTPFLICLSRPYSPFDTDSMPVQGFDEFMNIVMDNAAEVFVKDAQPRRELGAWFIILRIAFTHT